MENLRRYLREHHPSILRLAESEAIKFLIVGGINFVLTFIIFYFLLRISGSHYLTALTVSWAAGVVFSYILNFTWVFKPEEKIEFKRRLPKYALAQTASISLNIVALHSIIKLHDYDPFWAQLFLIPLIVIFNFSTAKFWSLKKS